jgi:hypothetical protein
MAIPSAWWLESKKCKYMLACFVHKENKDLSSRPSKLTRMQRMRKRGGSKR